MARTEPHWDEYICQNAACTSAGKVFIDEQCRNCYTKATDYLRTGEPMKCRTVLVKSEKELTYKGKQEDFVSIGTPKNLKNVIGKEI